MQKLKQVIIRKIESKFKDSKYVADIVKINVYHHYSVRF